MAAPPQLAGHTAVVSMRLFLLTELSKNRHRLFTDNIVLRVVVTGVNPATFSTHRPFPASRP
jgi:hypothetical protein